MYEVSIATHFSAAHRLVGYKGPCANPHGHNWEVEVFIRGTALDDMGMLVDFRLVKKAVAEVLSKLDHSDLNVSPAFKGSNPTSENIARYLHKKLAAKLDSKTHAVYAVSVRESPGSAVTYREETNDD
jgi:6-pyruvoyltetrahydropterin/6-carboxytetrahydropterin synthase